MAGLTWVTGRNAGRYRFVEAEVPLRTRDLEKAEVVTQRIESRIRDSVAHVERVLIHAEPMKRTYLRYALALADPGGTISMHFGEAPYFALVTRRSADGAIQEEQILPNPHQDVEKAKGIRVAEWLTAQKADVVLVKESLQGKGPVYVFADAGIQIQEIQADTLSEALTETDKPGSADTHSAEAGPRSH